MWRSIVVKPNIDALSIPDSRQNTIFFGTDHLHWLHHFHHLPYAQLGDFRLLQVS
jgi:hypothetical protein